MGFSISNKDIGEINKVREIARKYLRLSFNEKEKQSYELWPHFKSIISAKREVALDEKKWQKSFLAEIKYSEVEQMVEEYKETEIKYMSPIQTVQLKRNYFSYEHLDPDTFKEHMNKYNTWKQKLIAELGDIKEFIMNTDTHVCCRACGIKLAKLRDVHPISNFMRTFKPKPGTLK